MKFSRLDKIPVEGFTLIELVVVITIIGILAILGSRSITRSLENRKYLATHTEMDVLKTAMVGDPSLMENGVRTYFGYIGDVGDIPPSLDALLSDPLGAGDTLWKGPYVEVDFQAEANEYKVDAWGDDYTYNTSGDSVLIVSNGGGESFSVGFKKSDMLQNSIAIRVFSSSGLNLDNDNVSYIAAAWGGSWHNMSYGSDQKFHLNNTVPIGNRQVKVIALGDTIFQPVSVTPRSSTSATITVYPNYGVLKYIDTGSSTTTAGTGKEQLEFKVTNTDQETFNITNMVVSWSNGSCWIDQIPYLEKVEELGSGTVYWNYSTDNSGVRVGSGSEIELSDTWPFPYGETGLKLTFANDVTGTASPINMSGASYSVQFVPQVASTQKISFSTVSASCDPPNLIEYGGSVDGTNANQLTVNFDNTGDLAARVQAIELTWNTSETLEQIWRPNGAGTELWSGSAVSGDKEYFTSTQEFATNNSVDGDLQLYFVFASGDDVNGKTFYISFYLTDDSKQTIIITT